MNGKRILALATRIVQQIVRDKRTLALIFLAPLLIMTLLTLVLNNTSSTPTIALVRPVGSGSARINTLLNNLLPPADKIKIIDISSGQVDDTLNKGNADAALVFPADFAQSLAQREQPSVQIVLEGSDPTLASSLNQQLQTLTHQLGATLAAAQSGAGQQQPPASTESAPFTIAAARYLHGGSQYTQTDALAPALIGIFALFFVFLLTSVAFLRERSQGTMERIMVSPLTRTELVVGYICGFMLFALIQVLVILLFVVFVLRIHYSGNLGLIFLVAALLTLGGVNLGIFLSSFAHNEFQIIQFIPLVFGIQVLLSGIFWPLAQLPQILRVLAYLLPLTYANEALRAIMLKSADISSITPDIVALLVFALLMIVLSALTTQRSVA